MTRARSGRENLDEPLPRHRRRDPDRARTVVTLSAQVRPRPPAGLHRHRARELPPRRLDRDVAAGQRGAESGTVVDQPVTNPVREFPLMPVFDTAPYADDSVNSSIERIRNFSNNFSKKPIADHYHWFNIILGAKYFDMPNLLFSTGIIKPFDFGTASLTLYHLAPTHYLLDQSGHVDRIDSALLIVWNSDNVKYLEILKIIEYANRLFEGIEGLCGRPVPIPLSMYNLPDIIPVCTIDNENNRRLSHVEIARPTYPYIGELEADNLGRFVDHELLFEDYDRDDFSKMIFSIGLWQRKALRTLSSSQYAEAVVCINIWIESFVVQMSRYISDTLGSPIPNLENATRRGIHRFFSQHLGSKYLKGRWDHTDVHTTFGIWYNRCVLLRHKVVHQGYFPNCQEANICYNIAHNFIWEITEKISELSDPRLNELTTQFREYVSKRNT